MRIVVLGVLLFSHIVSASTCKQRHVARAARLGEVTDYHVHVGTVSSLMFVAASTTGKALYTTPIGVFWLGSAVLTADFVRRLVRQPRYAMLFEVITQGEKHLESLKKNKHFKKAWARVQRRSGSLITAREFIQKLHDGMDNGSFCKKRGKPFGLKRMTIEIAKSL